MNRTFAIHSFGCKVNQEEAEQLKALFTAAGWQEAEEAGPQPEEANLHIINTCTVTQVADKKARALIRRLRRDFPGAILAVTGCYAQTSPQHIAELQAVDIIAGLQERPQLPALVEQYLSHKEQLCRVADIGHNTSFIPIAPAGRQKRARAYLKVEDGCGQFCHYCVIPYARGPVRSLALSSALTEAAQLLEAGHRELVLSGIHIGAYGEDLPPGEDLPALIRGILALGSGFRLRLGSLEPQHFSPALLSLFADEERLCPHAHIPLQAGCDSTLAGMNRHYTTGEYAQLLATLRSLRPDIAITTDIMAGFPGETAEDFAKNAAFCREMAFAKMHVFPYSRRRGTVAADLPGQVSQQEKARRAGLLGQISQESAEVYARSFVGRKLQFLFEQEIPRPDGFIYAGHSENYLPLLVDRPPGADMFTVCPLDYREGYLLCGES